MSDENDIYFTVDTSRIKAKPETINLLIDTPVKQINALIKQVKSIEESLSEDDKRSKPIAIKLERLYSKINQLKNDVKKMIDICKNTNSVSL